MSYKRKTIDEWVLEAYTDEFGWNAIYASTNRSETCIQESFYRTNQPQYKWRVIKHRIQEETCRSVTNVVSTTKG